MKIYQVLRVHVVRQSESPLTLLVNAEGLAATVGWSNARLDASGDPNPRDAIVELSFEADRPQGPVPQVRTPISATLVIQPNHGADAVIVSSRTNSITVHASDFIVPFVPGAQATAQTLTTLRFGEEMPPTTAPRFEEFPTTFVLGEEDPPTTTLQAEENPSTRRLGEEDPSTFRLGEEDPTTFRLGEEGPTTLFPGEDVPTTHIFGEEPITDPRVDDPVGGGFGGGFGGPFGGF